MSEWLLCANLQNQVTQNAILLLRPEDVVQLEVGNGNGPMGKFEVALLTFMK